MKKYVYLSLVLISIFLNSRAQPACSEFDGDYNKIKAELIKRAKASRAYQPSLTISNSYSGNSDLIASTYEEYHSAWTDAAIEQLANKWVLVCKCKMGVSQQEWESQTYQSGFEINRKLSDHSYLVKGVVKYKDESVFGDLASPSKLYISSDCIKGKLNNVDISHTDCWNDPDIPSIDDDPQQFIKTFIVADCMCKKGVQTAEEAERLYLTMLDAYNSYKEFYPNSTIVLQKPTGPEQCSKIMYDANGQMLIKVGGHDKWNIYEDLLIKNKTRSYIDQIAAQSQNPDFIKFSERLKEIDDVNHRVDKYNEIMGLTPDQQDIEFNNAMNNFMQGIATAKFLIDLFTEDPESNDEEPSPEQKQAMIYMEDLRKQLQRDQYTLAYMRLPQDYTVQDINDIQTLYYSHDIASAPGRFLVIKYFWSNRYGNFTIDELVSLEQRIYQMDRLEILRKIDEWSNHATDNKSFNAIYLNNANISYKTRLDEFKIKQAALYSKQGDDEKAQEILNTILSKTEDKADVVQLMMQAIANNNYYLAASLYIQLKDIYTELPVVSTYNEYILLKNYVFPDRTDAIAQLGFGLYSNLDLFESLVKKSEIQSFENFVKDVPLNYSRFNELTDQAILNVIQAKYLISLDNPEEGLKHIDKALELILSSDGNKYKLWIKSLKFKLLRDLGDYEEAEKVYNSIIYDDNLNTSVYISKNELMYDKCLLLYEKKEYERALKGLELLTNKEPDPRYNQLRILIYNEQKQYNLLKDEIEKL